MFRRFKSCRFRHMELLLVPTKFRRGTVAQSGRAGHPTRVREMVFEKDFPSASLARFEPKHEGYRLLIARSWVRVPPAPPVWVYVSG